MSNLLDQKARAAAKQYKKLEQELLGLIIKIDSSKAFYKWGFSSLYNYLTDALELSPAIASAFINVARKAQQVPELKIQVESGRLSIYKAQRITAVLTPENSKTWIDLAQKKTHRELEREVAIASLKQAIKEKTKYIPLHQDLRETVKIKREIPRIELQIGVSEQLMLKIRRAQDLESQRNKKHLNLEETLEEVLKIYLDKKDPIKKAQRQKAKGKLQMDTNHDCNREINNNGTEDMGAVKIEAVDIEGGMPSKTLGRGGLSLTSRDAHPSNQCRTVDINDARAKSSDPNLSNKRSGKRARPHCRDIEGSGNKKPKSFTRRKALSADLKHQLQLRDGGQCTYVDVTGKRCGSRRFLEAHHIMPISQGGVNKLSNLRLLCSGHHRVTHSEWAQSQYNIDHELDSPIHFTTSG